MAMSIERENPVAGGTFWLFQYWDTLMCSFVHFSAISNNFDLTLHQKMPSDSETIHPTQTK